MKTYFHKLLVLQCLIILMSCETQLYHPSQILGDSFKDGDINLHLKYDCLDSDFQPVHLDIKNGLGILMSTNVSNEKIDSMKMHIMEVEGKDRYDLIGVEFYKTSTQDGVKTHEFKVTINKGSLDNERKEVTKLEALKLMSKGDLIDIHIKSDDSRIQSKIFNDDNNNGFTTDFGQQFCKSIVINP